MKDRYFNLGKETFAKLKELAEKGQSWGKEKLQIFVAKLKDRLCTQQDFEEDIDYAESDEEKDPALTAKILLKLKEYLDKLKSAAGKEKEKLIQKIKAMRAKICDKLSDYEEEEEEFELEEDYEEDPDEERGFLGKLGKGLKKVGKKFVKKMSSAMKAGVKKGMKMLKDNAIKVNPLECEGKFCKSCISMLTKTVCIKGTAERINKVAYILINPTIDGENKGEIKLKVGDVPRCVNFGGLLGKICLKGLEGKAKSSSGQANVKFCLAMLAEKYNVGCKFCAIYANKKFKPLAPKLFAGTQDENGEILQASNNGEDGIVLDADEVEID
uniref:Venom redulysin 3 n=1 Tax=Platymeris rhadamanthus TaxID=1134088 RepID=A0A6B9L3V9_PLARH|nr:venom redulysin 3 [Platymeris rhadamanthus]